MQLNPLNTFSVSYKQFSRNDVEHASRYFAIHVVSSWLLTLCFGRWIVVTHVIFRYIRPRSSIFFKVLACVCREKIWIFNCHFSTCTSHTAVLISPTYTVFDKHIIYCSCEYVMLPREYLLCNVISKLLVWFVHATPFETVYEFCNVCV